MGWSFVWTKLWLAKSTLRESPGTLRGWSVGFEWIGLRLCMHWEKHVSQNNLSAVFWFCLYPEIFSFLRGKYQKHQSILFEPQYFRDQMKVFGNRRHLFIFLRNIDLEYVKMSPALFLINSEVSELLVWIEVWSFFKYVFKTGIVWKKNWKRIFIFFHRSAFIK